VAEDWFDRFERLGLDGVVAKRADQRYVPGKREMVKVKHRRTADCVVVGYRLSKTGDGIGSLLLGVYDEVGRMHFIGHTSAFKAAERREILERVRPLETTMEAALEAALGGPEGGPRPDGRRAEPLVARARGRVRAARARAGGRGHVRLPPGRSVPACGRLRAVADR
jgi:ATP-dependent DNA ligase